jgi:dCMP deaminase
MLINAGIEEIVFDGEFPDELSRELLKEAGIFTHKFKRKTPTMKKPQERKSPDEG